MDDFFHMHYNMLFDFPEIPLMQGLTAAFTVLSLPALAVLFRAGFPA
jgi:hypothetical protein